MLSASQPARIPVIDGLRGIAILSVMIFYFRFFGGDLDASLLERIYRYASGLGSSRVDLFFVLSGYLITGILLQTRDRPTYYRTFYARRTLRIFPLYYASLAVFYGLGPLLMQWAQH